MSTVNTNDLYYVGGSNLGINFMPKKKLSVEKCANKLNSQRLLSECYVCSSLGYDYYVISKITNESEMFMSLCEIDINQAKYEKIANLCSSCYGRKLFHGSSGVVVN